MTAAVATTSPPVEAASPSTDGKAILLYDGECGLCQRSVRILKKLDWLKRLHFQDARATDRLPPCDQTLAPARLLEEMHVVTPDRMRAFAGFMAFRWLAWRLPLLWPVAPFLYLPGVPWLGNRVYLCVAKNRFRLVPCHAGACRVPLQQK